MTSTIALWYSRKKTASIRGRAPRVEVHINLWRHIQSSKAEWNLLDIGIRVIDPQDLGNLKLFVPVSPEESELRDLGAALHDEATLSAVFNEVLEIEAVDQFSGAFSVKRRGADYVTVHPCNIGADAIIEGLEDAHGPLGTLVTLERQFCRRFWEPGEHYIRLRFILRNGAHRRFIEDTASEDGLILSSIAESEITEVRFNEVRSLPSELVKRAQGEEWIIPHVQALHYFLIRDRGFDLIASHSSFRKIRRLETSVWDRYLMGAFPAGVAKKMVIYHWRFGGPSESVVDDVVTLAKYRRTRSNLELYLLIVIAFGALGSATHALLVTVIGWLPLARGGGVGEVVAFLALVAVVIAGYLVLKFLPK